MRKNYWIKKEDKNGGIIWRRGRAQGLEGAKGRIGNITKQIEELLKKKKKIKVLEIGTGFGRALLELKQKFGERIETHGTNYEKEWNQKLTAQYSLDQGFSREEIPKIYTKIDAGKKLRFKSNNFDFVFCQATVQYIIDRALFIEEVNRVLIKGGIAVLELQEYRSDHPKKYQNMFEIRKDNKVISTIKYLNNFGNIKVRKSLGRDWHYIIMSKVKKLNLKLKLIKHIHVEKINKNWWGTKIICEIRK